MSSPKKDHPSERLKLLRKRLGKTQGEMAGMLHISVKGYQRYESGDRDIPAATVDRAREHLGLNPQWLFDEVGEMFLPDAQGPEAERIRRTLGLSPENRKVMDPIYQRRDEFKPQVQALLAESNLGHSALLEEGLLSSLTTTVNMNTVSLIVRGITEVIGSAPRSASQRPNVAESVGSYGPMDLEVLSVCIEALEEARPNLPPNKKADALAALYELVKESPVLPQKATLLKFIRSAA